MTNDALRALEKIKSDVDGLFPKHTHGERFETIRAALAPVDVGGLANYIRAINGDNTMGAGELAEKITDHLAARGHIGGGEGWRDISTIPDNLMSGVDLWDDRNEKRHINCTFDLRVQAWSDETFAFVEIPTHWMPLPAAPKKEEK